MRSSLLALALVFGSACRKGGADPDGDLAEDDDCAPYDAASHPGAAEVCDGRDNDCDGTVDNGVGGTWFADADGDGFGDDASSVVACLPTAGAVTLGGDCDDADAAFHPGATEVCADVDANCDGIAGAEDGDDDGFLGCEECDDTDADVHPGAEETCDEVDEDCDGDVDEDATDAEVFYADLDDDGFGGDRVTALACEAPAGFLTVADDCDDLAATVNTAASEACNGVDDDCDGTPDDGATGLVDWFADTDGDGFGDAAAKVSACAAPSGHVANDDDCFDNDALVNPDAVETCSDTVDRNCDGSVGQADADADGTPACSDCDDSDPAVEPGASELCNGQDDDCDGSVDETAPTWYADLDGDGAGDDGVTAVGCTAPPGFTAAGGDCDDLDEAVNPSATEICNGTDDDCAGGPDADEVDADSDRWLECEGDCDDASATAHPGAVELCNAADDDCDGTPDDAAVDARVWYADADGDGYGAASGTQVACAQPTGFVAGVGDCNDADKNVSPVQSESCATSGDDDCDGVSNEADAIDAKAWFADVDGDGHGTPTNFTFACTAPTGRVGVADDCNDAKNTIYTGATEVWYDGIDQNCDGKSDYDQDGDGVLSYSKAGGGDCVDTDASLTTCGATAATAAPSCAALKVASPAAQSGTYYINPGTGAYQVYCDLETDGGGWTLILKTAAGSNALQYSSTHWTSNTSTLAPTSLNVLGGTDAKFASYNNLSFRELRGCAKNGILVNCVSYEFGTARTSAHALFSGPETLVLPNDPSTNTPLAAAMRDEFYAVFGPTGMAACLPQEMGFNVDAGDGNFYRWGFANNIPSQPCQILTTDDADGAIGWGITGQDCGATGAGFTNYFRNDTACGGTERSFDSWVWVR